MVNKKDFLENSGKKYPSSSSFSQNRCLLCRVGIGMSSSKGLKQRERRSLFLQKISSNVPSSFWNSVATRQLSWWDLVNIHLENRAIRSEAFQGTWESQNTDGTQNVSG